MPRRKRRSKGSGSVYHTARGWCVQRELPRSADGKRRFERAFFGRDKSAAHRQAAAWEAERVALAQHAQAGDTVHAWLEHWLTNKAAVVSVRTLEFYTRHVAYAVPHIGGVRLLDLTPQHIRDMLAALADGLSPRSRAHVRTVLRQALQLAVNDGVLPRNPVDAVEAPKVPKYDAYALTEAERRAFLAVADTSSLRAMWHLLIDLGPRHDEIISVRWSDLNRVDRTLRIRGTKTDEDRYLPLTDWHMELLAERWDTQQVQRTDNPRWKEHGYIFASEVGTKLLQSNVCRRFKEMLAAAKLPHRIRIHDLRHTAATNLIAAGNDIPTVQYITGHKDTAVLLEIYAHAHSDRNRAAVEKVEQRRRA